MLRYCLPALFAVLFLSCLSEPDCIITASNKVIIKLVKDGTDTAKVIIFDSVAVSGTDTLFHVTDTTSEVRLPVNPGEFQTTFYFYYSGTIADSMRVSYTRATRVINPSCGAFNYFQDLDVLLNTFPSVDILNRELSTSDAANLRVGL